MDSVDNPVTPVSEPPPIPLPEIKPEDLVAFSEMLVTQIPQTFATLKGVEIPAESLAFTDKERSSLMMTAPYACQYAPAWLNKMPAAMACVFMGTLIMSIVQRFGIVKRAAYDKEKAKAEIRRAEKEAVQEEKESEPVSGFPPKFAPPAVQLDDKGFPVG